MSITNLANLGTLNSQPIKTGTAISFRGSSFSSVDAIIAFLVKFNPVVESLDFASMKNLQTLPPSIGDCSALTTLDLRETKIENRLTCQDGNDFLSAMKVTIAKADMEAFLSGHAPDALDQIEDILVGQPHSEILEMCKNQFGEEPKATKSGDPELCSHCGKDKASHTFQPGTCVLNALLSVAPMLHLT